MWDSVIGVLAFAWTVASGVIASTGRDDVVALVVAFAVGVAAPYARDRVERWGTQYVNRFVRRGLKRIAANYAFCLAGILLASAASLIELRHLLPDLAQGAILGSAATAAIALTFMGWQARGPSRPNAIAFGRIFYEPATVLLTPLIMRRLMPTIMDSVPAIWQQIAEGSRPFVG